MTKTKELLRIVYKPITLEVEMPNLTTDDIKAWQEVAYELSRAFNFSNEPGLMILKMLQQGMAAQVLGGFKVSHKALVKYLNTGTPETRPRHKPSADLCQTGQ